MSSKDNRGEHDDDFLYGFDDGDLTPLYDDDSDTPLPDDFDDLDLLDSQYMDDDVEDGDFPEEIPERHIDEGKVSMFEDIASGKKKPRKRSPQDTPTPGDEYIPNTKRKQQSMYNINELVSFTRDNIRTDEDELDSVRKQIDANKRRANTKNGVPTEIMLLNEADDSVLEESQKNADPGDSKKVRSMFIASIALFALTLTGVALMAGVLINSRVSPPDYSQDEQTAASGVPIEELINNARGESSANNATPPNTTGGVDDSANNETSTATVEAPGNDTSGDTSGDNNTGNDDVVSDTNSVVYEVKAEGDIATASVSYINGIGSAEQNTGISLPWRETIDADKSVTPHVAVASSGRGTLTCSIIKDGETISEKTASGESPSVECRE